MARRNTIETVLTAKDNASAKFKKFDSAVESLQAGLSGLAVLGAAKAAFELGKLGAQSLRTKRAFENISGGAVLAKRNLDAMTTATRGAISTTEAMASANRLMQMGLANNADELGKITGMAVKLGTAMGRDAGQSIEEFALLLANQSIPRLDTFGISAGKARTRILELMEANEGMTRETAFMTAVMELGGDAMDRLGDDVEDAALQVEQAEAAWIDLKTAIGEALAPATGEAARGLTRVIQELRDPVQVIGVAAGMSAERIAELKNELGFAAAVTQAYAQDARTLAFDTMPQVSRAIVEQKAQWEGVSLKMRGAADEAMWLTQHFDGIPRDIRVELDAVGFGAATQEARNLKAALEDLWTKTKSAAKSADEATSRAGGGGGGGGARTSAFEQGGGVAFGRAVVGEGGPELVNLPPRSRVFSNEASRMINNNQRTANLTINTSAPHEPIIDDFRMMESFMGA